MDEPVPPPAVPNPGRPKRFVPPPPAPDRRLLLRIFLGALALTLTFGYVALILPDYGYGCALPLNLGCGILLFLAWKVAVRIPRTLSRATVALMVSCVFLLIGGQWNVDRVERQLREEIEARVFQRLGTTRQGYWQELAEREKKTGIPSAASSYEPFTDDEKPLLLKRIEERQPGWPRALGRLLPYTDVKVPDRGFRERYDRPYSFCATFMGGPLDLTNLAVLRVSLRAEDRLLSYAEDDRALFLPAWKKLQASEGR
ncbi:MAG: hypothetical protein JO332_12305 [Planctomycetaceae bacterium]|nr:hypothetical protein [Planctomycetaceae bacterium]